MACRHEVISSKPGRPGLTGPLTRSDRPIQSVAIGCHQKENYDIIHIKVPRLSKIFDKASDMRSVKKGIAEWVEEKSEPFVCLALKPSPQKHRLKK